MGAETELLEQTNNGLKNVEQLRRQFGGETPEARRQAMGAFAIQTRFAPLEPVVLMGHFGPKPWDLGTPVADRLAEVAAGLPTLRAIVALDNGAAPSGLAKPFYRFADLMLDSGPPDGFEWRRFPFNQPLFILFSSGTTGEPKCIEHGAGGTLLEHLKEHRLHCDLKPGEKLDEAVQFKALPDLNQRTMSMLQTSSPWSDRRTAAVHRAALGRGVALGLWLGGGTTRAGIAERRAKIDQR